MLGAEIVLMGGLMSGLRAGSEVTKPSEVAQQKDLLDAIAPQPHPALIAQLTPDPLTPDRCNLESFANAAPIGDLFGESPIRIVNDTAESSVARRLGYFFTLDSHLRDALENAFATGMLYQLDIEVVSQQELYQAHAEAQNLFDESTQTATIRLSDAYVIGDYDNPCALSLAGIENEFSEVILQARFYATYGRELQPSAFQESATLALSSLASLIFQGERFSSAEDVRTFLQETLAFSRRSYDRIANLSLSSPDQDSAFIVAWLNERLTHLLAMPFADGTVEFTVDRSAGRGNLIRPVVIEAGGSEADLR